MGQFAAISGTYFFFVLFLALGLFLQRYRNMKKVNFGPFNIKCKMLICFVQVCLSVFFHQMAFFESVVQLTINRLS